MLYFLKTSDKGIMTTEYPATRQDNQEAISTGYVIAGIIIVVLLAAAIIAITLFLASNYPAEIRALRDVFIIALALESCIFGVVLMIMLVMLIRLVNTVEFEIKPILEKTNDTLGTVRGTSQFVSKNVVDPAVKVGSYAAGVRRGVRALFGNPRRNLPD